MLPNAALYYFRRAAWTPFDLSSLHHPSKHAPLELKTSVPLLVALAIIFVLLTPHRRWPHWSRFQPLIQRWRLLSWSKPFLSCLRSPCFRWGGVPLLLMFDSAFFRLRVLSGLREPRPCFLKFRPFKIHPAYRGQNLSALWPGPSRRQCEGLLRSHSKPSRRVAFSQFEGFPRRIDSATLGFDVGWSQAHPDMGIGPLVWPPPPPPSPPAITVATRRQRRRARTRT
ncbi:hypothetical protein DFJ73DRAFT_837358 [Zopfochytrium polystomum]|nr:hypothetical protein DFJ73DRAFT_837358 [Zopfochytrium polystomum]